MISWIGDIGNGSERTSERSEPHWNIIVLSPWGTSERAEKLGTWNVCIEGGVRMQIGRILEMYAVGTFPTKINR